MRRKLRRLAELFKVASEPIRIVILEALDSGEREPYTSQLAAAIGYRPVTIGVHLSTLRACGLIETIKHGRYHHSRITPKGRTILDLIHRLATIGGGRKPATNREAGDEYQCLG